MKMKRYVDEKTKHFLPIFSFLLFQTDPSSSGRSPGLHPWNVFHQNEAER
jgi:hypothetical protein